MNKPDWNFKKELARKFVHLLSILILLIYFVVADTFDRQIALILLVLVLIVLLELEYVRLEIGRKIPILSSIWKLRREKEKDKLGGDVYILIGAILVLSIFDIRVAVAAILMTTFGDLVAALVGSRFGRNKLPVVKNKSWEGSVAEFVVDIIIGFVVFSWGGYLYPSFLISLIIIIVMALTATFVEVVVNKIDDNLLIPIFSGFNGQLVLMVWKWFY